jgi:hypothetical protein
MQESYGRAGWILQIQIDFTDCPFFTDTEYTYSFCVFCALH